MHSKNKGFTLVELLLVVAIIAVLTAISVPAVSGQLEKSRNAVDMHTAKTIANAILYYYVLNPDAIADLTDACNASPHYIQVSVGPKAAIAKELRPALYQAGLIGSYDDNTSARFNITCKSKKNWVGYRVAVSNYSKAAGQTGGLYIYYLGVSDPAKIHSTNSLSAYQGNLDPTGFKAAMLGAQ